MKKMKRIKTKMIVAIFSVFIVSFTVLILNIGANQGVARDAQSLLKDNYPSVKYTFKMLNSVDELNTNLMQRNNSDSIHHEEDGVLFKQPLLNEFEKNLKLQQNNVTEIGEQEITESLQNAYNNYYKSVLNYEYRINYLEYNEKYQKLREYILSIHDLNIALLESKNETIKSSALRVLNIQEKVGIVALAILSVLLITLPMMLINPIDNLAARMMKFYKTNFNKEIEIEANHELEKLEEIFEKIVLESKARKSDKE